MAERKGFKEHLRKTIVKIKRNPHIIGLVLFVLAFMYYSLNLTCISNTTAKIQGPGMGLCGFSTMLFSILSMVCYMNAFPHRKKVNVPMLVLMFAMVALVIYCDIRYRSMIFNAVYRKDNPIQVTQNTAYIAKAASLLGNHVLFLSIACVVTALMPVYSRLLRRIDTSIQVEGYGRMESIDISEE